MNFNWTVDPLSDIENLKIILHLKCKYVILLLDIMAPEELKKQKQKTKNPPTDFGITCFFLILDEGKYI